MQRSHFQLSQPSLSVNEEGFLITRMTAEVVRAGNYAHWEWNSPLCIGLVLTLSMWGNLILEAQRFILFFSPLFSGRIRTPRLYLLTDTLTMCSYMLLKYSHLGQEFKAIKHQCKF